MFKLKDENKFYEIPNYQMMCSDIFKCKFFWKCYVFVVFSIKVGGTFTIIWRSGQTLANEIN